ncbi:ABC transporter ATP-binding protein [Kushneria aurantia]|uniref:ABC transporter ATP-binding protein n=1 Tax=Kushneria aurantia TaxID=504092 RepID=A0ABV6G3Z8_9GAMM|nr:ABC transporter ATP-binding protein [Kushneria aurantia]
MPSSSSRQTSNNTLQDCDDGVLRIEAARLAFTEHCLFDGLSMTLPAHGWTCLLGRSGCGKSSLLRMIAGLPVAPDASLSVGNGAGQPLNLRVAWMAQQDLLLPWRRVIDNVSLGAAMRGERADRERAMALLEQVGLGHTARRYPQTLSGGERSRVALARTLYESAPLVLMDEPFAALDALTRLDLHALAHRLLAGRRVVMVTHDPLEALRMANQILVMRGTPARLDSLDVPSQPAPRDPATPAMSNNHARLLAMLDEVAA